MTESEGDVPWRSLHPLSLLANLVPQAWRTARAAWPLLLAMVVGGGSMGTDLFDLSLLFVFFGLTLVRTLTHFLTLRYRVRDGRFEVRSGLLHRQARVLDPARIQNIEQVQNLFHKAVGVVEVRVETAGDASTQGLLSALSVAEATRLQAELEQLVRNTRSSAASPATVDTGAPAPPSDETILVEGTPLEAVAYGLTRRTVGTVAVLTAVFTEMFGRMQPSANEARQVMQLSVIGPALMLAFAGSWAWSAGTALFRHWRFRLVRRGDRLINEEGLTTRRRVEIPIAKVQLVRADAAPLRRWMGYGSILIETAALGFADGEVRQAEGVVPMVETSEMARIFRAAAPNIDLDPWTTPLRPAHPRALWRMAIGVVGRTAAITAGAVWFLGPSGAWALLWLPVGIGLATLEWRKLGWLVTPEAVMARAGVLRRGAWVLDRAKIQSVEVVQTPLMQWHGLARVIVRVGGSAVALPDIGVDDALQVFQDLSPDPTPLPSRSPVVS